MAKQFTIRNRFDQHMTEEGFWTIKTSEAQIFSSKADAEEVNWLYGYEFKVKEIKKYEEVIISGQRDDGKLEILGFTGSSKEGLAYETIAIASDEEEAQKIANIHEAEV